MFRAVATQKRVLDRWAQVSTSKGSRNRLVFTLNLQSKAFLFSCLLPNQLYVQDLKVKREKILKDKRDIIISEEDDLDFFSKYCRNFFGRSEDPLDVDEDLLYQIWEEIRLEGLNFFASVFSFSCKPTFVYFCRDRKCRSKPCWKLGEPMQQPCDCLSHLSQAACSTRWKPLFDLHLRSQILATQSYRLERLWGHNLNQQRYSQWDLWCHTSLRGASNRRKHTPIHFQLRILFIFQHNFRNPHLEDSHSFFYCVVLWNAHLCSFFPSLFFVFFFLAQLNLIGQDIFIHPVSSRDSASLINFFAYALALFVWSLDIPQTELVQSTTKETQISGWPFQKFHRNLFLLWWTSRRATGNGWRRRRSTALPLIPNEVAEKKMTRGNIYSLAARCFSALPVLPSGMHVRKEKRVGCGWVGQNMTHTHTRECFKEAGDSSLLLCLPWTLCASRSLFFEPNASICFGGTRLAAVCFGAVKAPCATRTRLANSQGVATAWWGRRRT